MSMFNKPGSSPSPVKAKTDNAPRATHTPGPAPTGIFRNVKTARPKNDGQFFRQGRYVLRLDVTAADRDRKQVPYCKIGGTVVYVIDDIEGQSNRVGDEVVQILKTTSDYFDSDIQAFCAAVLDMQPEEMTEEAVEAVFCKDNPFAGWPVEVQAYEVALRDPDPQTGNLKMFTKIKWVRAIPAKEMLELDEATRERFWPGGALERLAEAEAPQQG